MASIAQFRVMGGAIGLAIVTAVLDSGVRSKLAPSFTPSQIDGLLKSAAAVSTLPAGTQDLVRGIIAEEYNIQMKVLAGLAAAQIPSSILMWQKSQIRV